MAVVETRVPLEEDLIAPKIPDRNLTPRAEYIVQQYPHLKDRSRAFDEGGLSVNGDEAWLLTPGSDWHLAKLAFHAGLKRLVQSVNFFA